MKKIIFLLCFLILADVASAQRRRRKPTTAPAQTQMAETPPPPAAVVAPPPPPPPKMADDIYDGAYQRTHQSKKSPVPLSYIREADAIYSWNVVRVIDLKQKQNLPLVHPQSNLTDAIMEAVNSGSLDGYIFNDIKLTNKTTVAVNTVMQQFSGADSIMSMDPVTLQEVIKVTKREFNPNDVVKYRVKEEWVFDKQLSTMQVRVIAIAPITLLKTSGTSEVIGELPMFWVYYPALRKTLAAKEVFNWRNDAAKMSMDDFFIKRMFSSYIYKESNVKDDRIEDYATGKQQLYESERVKNKLVDFEQALWEY
jgi:gliding motility associated protien GldN